MHDASTPNRQGPDVGTQYRSVIYTHGPEQQSIAEEITKKVSEQWYKKPVSTEVAPAGQWWNAEEYHQLYLNKNPCRLWVSRTVCASYSYPKETPIACVWWWVLTQMSTSFVRDFPPLSDWLGAPKI